MNEYLEWLGLEVRDRITGFTGVVSSISFDLYGCVQAIVTPSRDKDGKLPDSCWFDLKRLEAQGEKPVMAVPTFANIPGGQVLPPYPSKPRRAT